MHNLEIRNRNDVINRDDQDHRPDDRNVKNRQGSRLRRRWGGRLFALGGFLLLAGGLSLGAWANYSQQQEVLATAVQEKLPIKIVVYDNGKLGFVDIEQKAAGLVPVYTDLKNPDFGEVAKAMGLWGRSVAKAGELEESIQSWLAQRGPALLHVKVKPMQLVMPPSPFVSPEAVVGMGVYTARAMLQGKGHDVWEMMVENIP